jgi:hypothetical protein
MNQELREQAIRELAEECGLPADMTIYDLAASNLDQRMTLAKYAVEQGALVLEREARIRELDAILNTPETDDFFRGVPLEAAHQRWRWPSEQDAGKTPADWFWLVGYLAGKCLHAAIAGNTEKALHHTVSTAAALANWHRCIKGAGNMRPGIDTPKEAALATIDQEKEES